MSTVSNERFERLAELTRRVEHLDAEWRLLDARRRDRSPALVQLRNLYDWVAEKERDFHERFPEVAAATALPEAGDPDDLLGDASEAREWAALSARRSLLEDEWARILDAWQALAVDWLQALERRRVAAEAVDAGLAGVRERLLERERAISCAIAGVFERQAEPPPPPPPAEPPPPPVVLPDPSGLRGASRVSLGVPINLRVEHRLLQGDTENVSLTGVFVRTRALLPVGREVDLVFDLPERKGLQAVGKVVWLRPEGSRGGAGAGVRFSALPDETRRALEAFVRRTGRAARDEGTW